MQTTLRKMSFKEQKYFYILRDHLPNMASKFPSGTNKGRIGEELVQDFLMGENMIRDAIGKKKIKKVHPGRDYSDDY